MPARSLSRCVGASFISRRHIPQLLRPYRSPKGHRSRKQLVRHLGCALLGMLQDSTDFPCSPAIPEFQIFEPKFVHFEPVRLKSGHHGQLCISRSEKVYSGARIMDPSSPTAYFHKFYHLGGMGSIVSAIFLSSTATRLASSAESTV